MRILVTGGYGFLGSHVLDELLLRGHDVTVVDNLSTAELLDDGETPRYLRPAVKFRFSMPDERELSDVEAIVHLALRYPMERERMVWYSAFEGYVRDGVRLFVESMLARGPLKRFVICGPGRGCVGADAQIVSALRTLLGYWHRPPVLGVYCLWTPELTGARRTTQIREGELTASVEGAANVLANLADGRAKHRRDSDVYLEVGE
jgi:hypothetical protein